MGKLSKIRKAVFKNPDEWFWVQNYYTGCPKIYIHGVNKKSRGIEPEGVWFNTHSYKDFVAKVLAETDATVDIYFKDKWGNRRCQKMPIGQAILQFRVRD